MVLHQALLVLGLAAALSAGPANAPAGKGAKKAAPANALAGQGAKQKGHHTVHGLVMDAVKDKDKDEGSITVKVHHKKKKADAAPTQEMEKKFQVGKETKFEIVTGKKGQRQHKPATFADVHKGEHVVIVPKAGNPQIAEKVAIIAHKKKGK